MFLYCLLRGSRAHLFLYILLLAHVHLSGVLGQLPALGGDPLGGLAGGGLPGGALAGGGLAGGVLGGGAKSEEVEKQKYVCLVVECFHCGSGNSDEAPDCEKGAEEDNCEHAGGITDELGVPGVQDAADLAGVGGLPGGGLVTGALGGLPAVGGPVGGLVGGLPVAGGLLGRRRRKKRDFLGGLGGKGGGLGGGLGALTGGGKGNPLGDALAGGGKGNPLAALTGGGKGNPMGDALAGGGMGALMGGKGNPIGDALAGGPLKDLAGGALGGGALGGLAGGALGGNAAGGLAGGALGDATGLAGGTLGGEAAKGFLCYKNVTDGVVTKGCTKKTGEMKEGCEGGGKNAVCYCATILCNDGTKLKYARSICLGMSIIAWTISKLS